jgi:dihydroorotate dehydrogenase
MSPPTGWYAAVGRPLFLTLPPEAAHRVAQALLGLPLPWRRIGGVPVDTALRVDLAGVPLAMPVGLAAGFDKTCRHLDALGALGFGFVVGGTITRLPRRGNPKPRIARDRAARSMTNAMGLPNPGAAVAARHLASRPRTSPRFVSLADEATEDVLASLVLLEPHADGLELNASCPNVAWGRDRDQEAHVGELLRAIRDHTSKPVFVKLPPFATATEREVVLALVAVAAEGGADGLVVANTRSVDDRRLAVGRGGRSGRALWARTPASIREVREVTDLPIVACGGIAGADDVLTCLDAGATAVQVYTAIVYEGPALPGEIARGLLRHLRARGLVMSDLVGTSKATG